MITCRDYFLIEKRCSSVAAVECRDMCSCCVAGIGNVEYELLSLIVRDGWDKGI